MSAVVGHYHLTHPSKHTCMLHVLKAASQFPQHLMHAAHSVNGIDHRKAATMRSNSEKDVDAILSTSGVTRVYVYVEQQPYWLSREGQHMLQRRMIYSAS